MSTVIVPADEAATLLPRPLAMSDGYPGLAADVLGHHPPARRFVVHTANIDPEAECETCDGRGYETTGDLFPGRDNHPCPTCNGAGAVPAVVTLAVANEFGRYPGLSADVLGFRPVGTATVAHCWPIVAVYPGSIQVEVDRCDHCDRGDTDYIARSQIVGNSQPGAWILELADVTPV